MRSIEIGLPGHDLPWPGRELGRNGAPKYPQEGHSALKLSESVANSARWAPGGRRSHARASSSIFWNYKLRLAMFVLGTEVVERYFRTHAGHKGIGAARTQYHAWLAIAGGAQWHNPEDVKASYPKASILKGSRVVFQRQG
jgi:hypothetical protein